MIKRANRIAVLSPVAWRTPPRHYGAWETVASNLTEGLVARGWNVTLFATEVLPHLRKIWQEDGFTHHWWPKRLGGSPRSTTQKVEVQAS